MFSRKRQLVLPEDRGPLRVMFIITSMPVGGAETLLVNLIRRLDREQFEPYLCCLKEYGLLGEVLAEEVPAFQHQLTKKYDPFVLGRLTQLMRRRKIDAVVTVGAGDKMFWGRLAAWRAGVPVVLSALHSTGWPDGVGRMNRWLTPLTDGFIGVAKEHGRHLVANEKFPAEKVHVIPNGVDVDRFQPCPETGLELRRQLNIPADAPVCGLVAALRQEKNHLLFLRTAAKVQHQLADAHFVIVGDGPEREKLEAAARSTEFTDQIHFLGTRSDIPQLLTTLDLFLLTSHNEANPVSILEAMAVGLPVVSTRVGSVEESVAEGVTGHLAQPGDADQLAGHVLKLLHDPSTARKMGQVGRQTVIADWSLQRMVQGYQRLISDIYRGKCPPAARGVTPACDVDQEEMPVGLR